jgi:hypothetical protein
MCGRCFVQSLGTCPSPLSLAASITQMAHPDQGAFSRLKEEEKEWLSESRG